MVPEVPKIAILDVHKHAIDAPGHNFPSTASPIRASRPRTHAWRQRLVPACPGVARDERGTSMHEWSIGIRGVRPFRDSDLLGDRSNRVGFPTRFRKHPDLVSLLDISVEAPQFTVWALL